MTVTADTLPILDVAKALADVLQPRRRRTLIEVAEQEYRLPDSHTLGGLVKLSNSPFWFEPMLYLDDGITKQVTVMACTQSGKTTILGNADIAHRVLEKPGNYLDVLPRREDFKKRMNEDIIKTLLAGCEAVRAHISSPEDIQRDGIDFDNMRYQLGAASSPEDLSGFRAPNGKCDELKSFQKTSGKLGHPVELLRDRGRTYDELGMFTMLLVSSPGRAGDVIESEYDAGNQCEERVPCPHCDEWQQMTWDNIHLDKGSDGKILHHTKYASGKHAWYACPHCGAMWTERERFRAVRNGIWRPQAASYTDDKRAIPMDDTTFDKRIKIFEEFRETKQNRREQRAVALDRLQDRLLEHYSTMHWSFRVPSWLVNPVFTTIGTIATRFAVAMEELVNKRDPQKLRAWRNNECAEADRDTQMEMNEMAVERHVADGHFDRVPERAMVLTCGVDVQARGFYVVIYAWAPDWESWLMYADYVEAGYEGPNGFVAGDTKDPRNYDSLLPIINAQWPHEKRKAKMGIAMSGLDSSDGTRTYQVYDFCNRVNAPQRLVPLKGDAGIIKPPHIKPTDLNSEAMIERRRARKRQLRYNPGQTLYRFSPLYYKSMLWQWTQPDVLPGPGYLHFPNDVSATFKAQFCAQYLGRNPKTRRPEWRNRKGHAAEHYNDASAMAAVGADLIGVGNLREGEPRKRRLRELVKEK